MTMMNSYHFYFTGWEKIPNKLGSFGHLVSDDIGIRVEVEDVEVVEHGIVAAQAKAISDRLCDLFDAMEQRRKGNVYKSTVTKSGNATSHFNN